MGIFTFLPRVQEYLYILILFTYIRNPWHCSILANLMSVSDVIILILISLFTNKIYYLLIHFLVF